MLKDRDALYRMLPATIRQRDQEAGGTLEQLLAIVGEQAALIERDLQQMLDNWFIETCEPWVVPYIADLLGYGPQIGNVDSPALLAVRAPRREVADWIAHERRKGSLMLLQELAWTIAQWPAVAVEFYRQLVVAQHLDHLRLQRVATADLHGRNEAQDLAVGCRLADVRRSFNAQSRGQGNIPDVGLFVYRMRHYGVTHTSAYCQEDIGLHCYSFSVLGNDAPLYRKPHTHNRKDGKTTPGLPLPITRRMLEIDAGAGAAAASADPALVGFQGSFSITVEDWPKKGRNTTFTAEDIIPADLSTWSYQVPKNRVAVDPELGRIKFAIRQAPRKGVVVSYGYGFAMDIGGGEYARPPLALPPRVAHRRVYPMEADAKPDGTFGSIADAIDDWQAKRPAEEAALVVELSDSGVYRGRLDLSLNSGESVWIIAAPGTRPVLWLADENAGRSDAISVRGDIGSRFALDGVLLVGRGISIAPLIFDTSQDNQEHESGKRDLCQVLIRHSTLVPGWSIDCNCHARHPSEPSIVLDGSHACLRIEHSIVGPIQAWSEALDDLPATVSISDSIVDATGHARQAIGGNHGEIAPLRLTVARSTVVGEVRVHAIELAENSIFFGDIMVARRHTGCIRYSYVQWGSRTPRKHFCQPADAIQRAFAGIDAETGLTPAQRSARKADAANELALRLMPRFQSMHYGTPDYLRLSSCTERTITGGALDESEMGVYHDLFEPQRMALLSARLADYVPAGFHAGVLFAS